MNFGHVSFQRLALEVRALKKYPNGTAAYLEEGIVRRELSDNFVFYSPDDYDELSTAAQWAQDSLELHASDEREFLYTFEELDNAKTHDDLWNAAQKQLINEGKMHGFLRMYWAKKVSWIILYTRSYRKQITCMQVFLTPLCWAKGARMDAIATRSASNCYLLQ